MLVAAAGNDLHDIIKEAGIVTVLRNAANAIPYAAYVPEVPLVPIVSSSTICISTLEIKHYIKYEF